MPSFPELLEKDGSVSIQLKNIESLTSEMFRVIRELPPPNMNDIFIQKGSTRYKLRQISEFSRPLVKLVFRRSDSVSFLGQTIWEILPYDYKDIGSLNALKNKVNKWKLENCPCRFCKIYINNIGFVWEQKKSRISR